MPDIELTSAELDRLEQIAKAATPGQEWFADMSGLNLVAEPPGNCLIDAQTVLALCATGEHVYQVLPFIAAAQPATILRLISLARSGLEARKAEEWLPIETAPRDGTSILGGHEQAVFTVWWDDEAGGWVDGNTSDYREELTTYQVSHWRHLPAPPAIRALSLTEGGDKP